MNKIRNLILSLATAFSIGGCGTKSISVNTSSAIKNKVSTLLEYNSSEKLNDVKKKQLIMRTIELIGENEYLFFKSFFNIQNDDSFLNNIFNIQKNNNLQIDGIIGENTLKVIYIEYYNKGNSDNLSNDVKKRLEIYNEMSLYENNPRSNSSFGKLLPSNIPSIFSKKYYLGINGGENISGTFINKQLLQNTYDTIEKSGNIAILLYNDGKYFVAVYIDHKLELLSYTSIGSELIQGGIKTKMGTFQTKKSNKYYISGAKDSVFNTSEGLKGAIMPYALHVDGGIYAHAGYVNGKRKSHGCIRFPIYYAKGLYEIYKKEGNLKWIIINN